MSYAEQMTYENILESMLNNVPDNVDKREGSIIYDALAPQAAELAKAYIELDIIMDETFVDTASMQYLMLRCKERGVSIKDATPAVIEGTFTPDDAEIDIGARFNCNDVNYTVTGKLNNGKYRLECETAGAVGNIYSGFLLPIQYIEGLETAQITTLLIPGEDADDTDSLRERYYDNLKSQAFGGNIADYKAKVKALNGVGGVRVTPVWNGGGTVKLTIIDSEYNVPSKTLVDAVQEAIDPAEGHGKGVGIAPIGHVVTVEGVVSRTINIKTKVTFATGWNWESSENMIKKAIESYFEEVSREWENSEASVVRISQVENKILNLSCTLDIEETSINNITANIQLNANEIPVMGTVSMI